TVTKHVHGNYTWGGHLDADDFKLYVANQYFQTKLVVNGSQNQFNAGLHYVFETPRQGYEQVYIGDDCQYYLGIGFVYLEIGKEYACDVVNEAITGSITIYKKVINNNGGRADADDFKLYANYTHFEHGEKKLLRTGEYTIWESQEDGYRHVSTHC